MSHTASDFAPRKPTMDDVRAWAKANPKAGLFGPIPSRSCWECNGSHEHLKTANYPFQCFECGKIFLRGVEVETLPGECW